jgi:lipid-binding SYLF domain-containing protein
MVTCLGAAGCRFAVDDFGKARIHSHICTRPKRCPTGYLRGAEVHTRRLPQLSSVSAKGHGVAPALYIGKVWLPSLQKARIIKPLRFILAIGIAGCALLTSTAPRAQSKDAIDVSVQKALQEFNRLDPAHVNLQKKAAGVLIFPQVTKGGVALAAEYGAGVLQINGATVGYYSLAAASVGFTAGMATRSEIILFMTPEALDRFMKSRGWSIGADTGLALLSKGAAGDFDANTFNKPILGFVFGEKGLIADFSLEGSKINRINR